MFDFWKVLIKEKKYFKKYFLTFCYYMENTKDN